MAPRRPPVALALAVACGAPAGSSGSDNITTANATTDASTSSTVNTLGGTGSAPGTDPPELTSGPSKDVGADEWDVPKYCGALDVILAVERAPFIQLEMAYDVSYDLTAGITERLPGWDVHYLHIIGATSTLPLACESECVDQGVCDTSPELPCEEFSACDWTPGAGQVWRSYLTQCLPGPRRWVDAATEDAAALSFCLWETGAMLGPQSALPPLLASVSPFLAEPDGCNAGFLRDDAWLVPVIVSQGYPGLEGDPASWAAELAASKGGDLDAVLPVAILDPQMNAADPPGCEEGIGDKTNGYHELIEQFPVGRVGSLCEPFTPPILEIIEHIAKVCRLGEIPG